MRTNSAPDRAPPCGKPVSLFQTLVNFPKMQALVFKPERSSQTNRISILCNSGIRSKASKTDKVGGRQYADCPSMKRNCTSSGSTPFFRKSTNSWHKTKAISVPRTPPCCQGKVRFRMCGQRRWYNKRSTILYQNGKMEIGLYDVSTPSCLPALWRGITVAQSQCVGHLLRIQAKDTKTNTSERNTSHGQCRSELGMGSDWGTAAEGFIEHKASHSSLHVNTEDQVSLAIVCKEDSVSHAFACLAAVSAWFGLTNSGGACPHACCCHKVSGRTGPSYDVNDCRYDAQSSSDSHSSRHESPINRERPGAFQGKVSFCSCLNREGWSCKQI